MAKYKIDSNNTRAELDLAIQDLLIEQLGVDKSEVTPQATIYSLGADSLDAVEIVMAVEEEFGLDIPDEDWELCAGGIWY